MLTISSPEYGSHNLNYTQSNSGAQLALSTAVDNLVCNSFPFLSCSFNRITVLT